MVQSRVHQSQALALSIQNLSVSYDNKPIVSHISFDIEPHTVTAIIGPSGCGKSSLLMSINQLAQEQGASVDGDIFMDGRSIVNSSDLVALRQKIGYIFQRPNPFPFSVEKNLDLPLQEHGVPKNQRQARIKAALKEVGLWDEIAHRLSSNALSLSGGQQQRLCIARALVLEPKIILMDEPCSALDPIATAKIEALIQKLTVKMTVVIVTHNLSQARRIADKVAFMWMESSGFLVEAASTNTFFTKPKSVLAKAYIQGAD